MASDFVTMIQSRTARAAGTEGFARVHFDALWWSVERHDKTA
jgi:hypothetical protein